MKSSQILWCNFSMHFRWRRRGTFTAAACCTFKGILRAQRAGSLRELRVSHASSRSASSSLGARQSVGCVEGRKRLLMYRLTPTVMAAEAPPIFAQEPLCDRSVSVVSRAASPRPSVYIRKVRSCSWSQMTDEDTKNIRGRFEAKKTKTAL